MGSILQQINNPDTSEPTIVAQPTTIPNIPEEPPLQIAEPEITSPKSEPTLQCQEDPPNEIKPTNLKRASTAVEIQRSRANNSKLSGSLEVLNEGAEPVRKMSTASSIASLSDEKATNKTDIREAIKKHQQNKRSEIVASVTERLYAKQQRRKMSEARSSSSSLMSDLSICSNARTRLQEISFKALNASRRLRRVSLGIQTDMIRTTRVKDVGINTPADLNQILEFTKDACIETTHVEELIKFESKSVGSDSNFKLTRSCGNTTDTDSIDSYIPYHKRYPSDRIPLSFTKYITRNTQTPEPVCYKTSVNIHFNCESPDGSISDDSLDGRKDCPPDLLHNHSENNSLLMVEEKVTNYAAQYGNIEVYETLLEFVAGQITYAKAGIQFETRNFHRAKWSKVYLYRARLYRSPIPIHRNPKCRDHTARHLDQIPSYLNQAPRYVDQAPRYVDQTPRYLDQTPRHLDQDFSLSSLNFLNAATYFLTNIPYCSHRVERDELHAVRRKEVTQDPHHNKYEKQLVESCDRLEDALNKDDIRIPRLLRKSSRSSPRAYLLELQKLRRRLIEDSRDVIASIDGHF